ncbi:MAG TPA: hypothetical protein VHC49_00355 [Mycobacteriales bacterium]|nr:hypothetical protein [Mycobacteriales bacterium]
MVSPTAIEEFAAAVARARSALRADAGVLWGHDASGARWVGALGGVWHATADPGLDDFPRHSDLPLWSGPAPAEDIPANTGIDWAGGRWAKIWLEYEYDVRLLLHEAWHADLQASVLPDVEAAETGIEGADLLDRSAGRIWLRLELSALQRALAAPDDARSDVAAALAFRRRRDAIATADEREREAAFELVEGLPEYSAWRWSGATDSEVAVHVGGPPPQSWVRAFCYRTGPAYGFLLDRYSIGWRQEASAGMQLSERLSEIVTPAVDADATATAYGIATVRAEELQRDRDLVTRLEELRARFIDGPVLRIPLLQRALSFNPQRDVVLPEGTVRGTVQWTAGGRTRLIADEALLLPDWSEIRVPLDTVPGDHSELSGPGWTFVAGDGWRLEPDGQDIRVRPPAGS